MTTKQFLKNYTVPHLQSFEGIKGVSVFGLMMLKPGNKWFTTVLGWAFCLPRRFKRMVSNLTPEFNLPVLDDERFIDWAENHNWKDNNPNEDSIAVEGFLSNLIGKPAVSMCTDMFEHILSDYCWQSYKIEPKDGKRSQAAYRISDLGWEFGDHFPGVQKAEIDRLEHYKATNEFSPFKEPTEIEGGQDFLDMLTSFAKHIVICPFVFPKLILGRRDGEIYLINTPDTVYFTIRRSI